jgi:hypothetical protein
MTTTTPTDLPFTPIIGVPTAGTIRLLTKEVYAAARAVYSAGGGGQNGHLGIAMPPAAYLARANVPFDIPIHPGIQAPAPAGATAPVITELNRVYDKRILTYATYSTVRSNIRTKILTAIEPTYITTLQDPLFGFADVTINQFLTHLRTTYGTLDAAELEDNRNQLSAAWNPDQPLENFWSHIIKIRDIASTAGRPIDDATTVQLTLSALRQSGVHGHSIDTWEERPTAEHTWANYQAHFIKHDKLRIKRLTAQSAGFHGANQASTIRPPPAPNIPAPPSVNAATARQATSAGTASPVNVDGTTVYYCWSHGAQMNPNHTSLTCENQKTGHKTDATFFDRKNGSPYINCGRSGRPARESRA